MEIGSRFKRAYLRRLYRAVTTTLEDKLNAELDTLVAAAERGKVIASTSARGTSVAFSVPGLGNPRQGEMVELIEELLTLHDDAEADLISGGYATPTDAQIYAEMLFRLQPVKSFTNTFTNLRAVRSST